jgi:hypothetical protein
MTRGITATLRPLWMCCLAAALLGALPACGTYQLRGRVIDGPMPMLLVVSPNDARLQGHGMPGVLVDAIIDPDRPLQQTRLPAQMTDNQGHFAIPVEATGAGLLEYNVQITARLDGYTSVRRTLKLPGRDKRILIVVTPGPSGIPLDEPDILDETRRLGEHLTR